MLRPITNLHLCIPPPPKKKVMKFNSALNFVNSLLSFPELVHSIHGSDFCFSPKKEEEVQTVNETNVLQLSSQPVFDCTSFYLQPKTLQAILVVIN